jgi:hypothetical protein
MSTKVATTLKENGQIRIPKQTLQYQPKGRRNVARPRKRRRDQLQGTGTKAANPSEPMTMMMMMMMVVKKK